MAQKLDFIKETASSGENYATEVDGDTKKERKWNRDMYRALEKAGYKPAWGRYPMKKKKEEKK